MKDKFKKVTVVIAVDRIRINGVNQTGMKGKSVEIDPADVSTWLAHKFIEKPAEVTDHE